MKFYKTSIQILVSIIVNRFGDVLFDLFITWNVVQTTGKFINAVYILGTSVAFRAIIGLFIGNIVDRYNKKKLIIFSNISSVAVISIFAIYWSFVVKNISLGVLFILTNNINNEIYLRSYTVLTSELFETESYIKFQSIATIANRVVYILGASIAGFMMEFMNAYTIFAIDIGSIILSTIAFSMVNYDYKKNEVSSDAKLGLLSLVKELINPFKYIFNSSFILTFVILMFLLNFAYGCIPDILPIWISDKSGNALLLGMLKSAMSVGEILGMALVAKFARYVSLNFKISMIGNCIVMICFALSNNSILLIMLFLIYGTLDSLTQPLFSYTVTKIDVNDRGKILAGIDSIILLSPIIGMYAIGFLMDFNSVIGFIALALIFAISLCIILFNAELRGINLSIKVD